MRNTKKAKSIIQMKITEYTLFRDEEAVVSNISKYDSKGNLIEEIDYDDFGKSQSAIINQYNSDNQLIKVEQYGIDNEMIDVTEIIYSDGEISQKIISFPDDSKTFEHYRRSENSLEIVTEDEDGEFEGSVLRKLTNGLTTELIRINFMKKQDSHLINEYNEKQQLIKVKELNAKGKLERAYAFKYDDYGNRICEDELDRKERLLSRTVHKFEEDRLLETQAPNYSIKIEYENKQPIKEMITNPDGSVDITNYKYNDNKQKIEEIVYQIPYGEAFDERFLAYTKRFVYED